MSATATASSQSYQRKPDWIRVQLPETKPEFFHTRSMVNDLKLHTVCESAKCPNRWECWSIGTATFMIAGDRCTRACKFCAVATAKPLPLDPDEPRRVAEAAVRMNLKHAVVTAVARDDLKDGGADHFRQTIEALRAVNSEMIIEVLTPDFRGRQESFECVLSAKPHIYNHNVETVERLTPLVRSRAKYRLSLQVLKLVKELDPNVITKSGLMLGLGEKEEELFRAMDDLRENNVQVLTLGQYLQPTAKHLPVVEYITPANFKRYGAVARIKGFEYVSSGPMVRSSYHAADFPLLRDRKKEQASV